MSHSLRAKLSGLRYKGIIEDKDYKRLCHALDLEKAEQESCDDVVSRQVVKEQMIKYGFHAPDMTVTEFVEDLSPVRPQEPKTGHWISHYDEGAKEGWYECDRCHTERAFNTDYCPDCGADMRGAE